MIKSVIKTNRKNESNKNIKLVKPERKFERISSDNLEIGKRLDAVCRRQSERELERIEDVRRALKEIESDARKLGFDFKVNDRKVDAFCDRLDLDGDEFAEIMWIDGEPGDRYCLVVREWDDDDRVELLGDFYFDEI